MDKEQILLADFGGTHIRVAFCNVDDTDITNSTKYVANDFSSPIEALKFFLSKAPSTIKKAVIAAAGPASYTHLSMTNRDWVFEKDVIKKEFNLDRLVIVNDFEVAAYAYPKLESKFISKFMGKDFEKFQPGRNLIVGAGTGFGCAIVEEKLPDIILHGGEIENIDIEPVITVFPTEFGRILCGSLQYINTRIKELIFEEKHPIILEDILSGSGIQRIYDAVCKYNNVDKIHNSSEEIVQAQDDENAKQAIEIFFDVLAITMADLTVAFHITGDIFFAGGLMRALDPLVDKEKFRQKMISIGQQNKIISEKNIYLTNRPHIGVFGGLICARQYF